MRVLVFGLSANRGGVESFILNYTRRILDSQSDIRFDFVVFDEMPDCVEEFKARGSRFFLLRNRVVDPFHFASGLRAIFSERDIDLVWYNVCTLSDITLLRVASARGVPCLVHSHSSQSMGNWINRFLHYIHRHHASRLARALCACSDPGARFMFPRHVVAEHGYTVVPNAIDAERFAFSPEDRQRLRNRLGFSDDTYVLGNVGRLHPQKNQAFLLSVLEQMREARAKTCLLLVGDGPIRENLLQQARERDLEEEVVFVGAVANTAPYYAAMDCFVFPSQCEGFGIAALEAQASGLPCLLSDAVPSDVVVSEQVRRIPTDDAKVWAATCVKCAQTPMENRSQGVWNVKSSGYDLEDTVPRVADLLRSVAFGTFDV